MAFAVPIFNEGFDPGDIAGWYCSANFVVRIYVSTSLLCTRQGS